MVPEVSDRDLGFLHTQSFREQIGMILFLAFQVTHGLTPCLILLQWLELKHSFSEHVEQEITYHPSIMIWLAVDH